MAFLVVEDDRALADVLRAALTAGGLRPVIATSLGEAALVLETVEVRGMVVDLDLEGGALDWLTDLGLLHPPLARATIALVSADVSGETRQRVSEIGAGLLPKPFTPREVADALHGHVLEVPHAPHRTVTRRSDAPPRAPRPRDPHDDA